MPLGAKPKCSKCGSMSSDIWHRDSERNILCHQCWITDVVVDEPKVIKSENLVGVPTPSCSTTTDLIEGSGANSVTCGDVSDDIKPRNEQGPGTRSGNTSVSARGKMGTKKSRGRNKKFGSVAKSSLNKGKGRRSINKKQPSKALSVASTTVTTGHLFHNDIYYQLGDIVSVVDEEGGIYYAQIRGLLQDQYCEKSVVVTWLIPTQSSPPPECGFDPLTYILGPEEELPRKLDYFDFVCHAPNEYYKLDENIRMTHDREAGYIWTSMGAVRRTVHV